MMGGAAVVAVAVATASVFTCTADRPRHAQLAAPAHAAAPRSIREPAVAGLFYPGDAAALSNLVDSLLADARPHTIDGELRALVCPHAGYSYSGPVAATGYRLLLGREFETVVILAPSHYALFQGASVSKADAYRTPLGLVPVSSRARELARISPFVLEPRCRVQRPEWSREASKPEPAVGEDTPDTWEHSAEVQVPFLQKVSKNCSILPVITGKVDPESMAKALAGFLDDKTLLVVSTDLSHYYPYEVARKLDAGCVKAICEVDIEKMTSQEACGRTPVLTLLHLARQKGWKAKLVDSRNSGDTAGHKEAVVGYSAIAFYEPRPQSLTTEERRQLLSLARQTLGAVLAGNRPPEPGAGACAGRLAEKRGCFVTLTRQGNLRGCIGHIRPQEPLFKAVMANAESAALRDPRFAPVQPEELDSLEIELSILTTPEPLKFRSADDLLNRLRPHYDGVVLEIGDRVATYLPQVWSQIPDRVRFLDSLAEKAGCVAGAWRGSETRVLVYHVECFSESEM